MPRLGKTARLTIPRAGVEMRVIQRPLETRDADGDQKPLISGYAALFDTETEIVPGMRERIARGAFSDALSDDVRALLNHDPHYVLGRTKSGTLRLVEDDVGLRFEVDPPDTQWARDLAVTMRRGDVSGASFAFRMLRDSWTGADLRTLEKVKLFDVSVVTYPAYPQTSVSSRGVDWAALGEIVDLCDRAETLTEEERETLRALVARLAVVARSPVAELDLLRRRLALADIL